MHQELSPTLLSGLWAKVEVLLTKTLDPEKISQLNKEDLEKYLARCVDQFAYRSNLDLSPEEKNYLLTQLRHETTGFGPIQELIEDRTISDILINGPQQVYLERNGQLELTTIQFRDRDHLIHLLMRAIAGTGRRVDVAKPYLDVILPDRSRLNAVVEPIVAKGPIISIRKFSFERFTLDELCRTEFMSDKAKNYLIKAIISHLNIIIVGGAASGKTTLLNALLDYVPSRERIVVIEETSELSITGKHAIHMQTRTANIEGQGEITQRDLLRNSVRMRPDRIIVGEIRGGEVLEMFQAMNIGYDGSLSSVHASHIEELPMRLTNMAALTGYHFPVDFINRQIAGCLHIVVQLGRFYDGSRRITHICEVRVADDGGPKFQEIYRYRYLPDEANYVTEFFPDNITVLSAARIKQYGG